MQFADLVARPIGLNTLRPDQENLAQSAFAEFLNDRSLNAQQIRFVEMVIDQLTAKGVMKEDVLFEAPFSQLRTGGRTNFLLGKRQL